MLLPFGGDAAVALVFFSSFFLLLTRIHVLIFDHFHTHLLVCLFFFFGGLVSIFRVNIFSFCRSNCDGHLIDHVACLASLSLLLGGQVSRAIMEEGRRTRCLFSIDAALKIQNVCVAREYVRCA